MSARHPQPRCRTNRLAAAIEALEARQLMATFTVTSTANSGGGTLRQAIIDANANAGFDQIQFNISPGGAVTIAPTSQLPTITGTANLNGTNLFPGMFFERRVVLNGQNAPGANGLVLSAFPSLPNLPAVRELQLFNWSSAAGLLVEGSNLASITNVDAGNTTTNGNNSIGIYVKDSNNTTVRNCEGIGNGVAGIAVGNSDDTGIDFCMGAGNGNEGVSVFNGSTGSIISASTFISNVGPGVRFSGPATTSNSVISSVIGYTGTSTAAPNNVGVSINDGADNNVIGGPNLADRNFIAGNSGANIRMDSVTSAASGNIVQGNFIGLNASGSAVTGAPSAAGVSLSNFAGGNFIGQAGATPNVISGNDGRGISISSNSNIINNNRIGTNEAGTAGAGNSGDGIFIGSAFSNIVRNCLVSGNAPNGIRINNGGQNLITGCLVGTNLAGTSNLGNGAHGISIDIGSESNIVGGDAAADRNVISGNGGYGVLLYHLLTQDNVIKGNYIGTNAAGTSNVGNGLDGVGIRQDAQFNTIGPNNVISGNNFKGVIINETASNNLVTGNFIGTNAAGTGTIANATEGILIDTACEDNRITGNVIGGNFADNVKNLGDFTLINNNHIGTTIAGVTLGGVQGINQFGSDGTISGNILSGNSQHGLVIDGGDRNVVNGNYVGVNVAGTGALPNGSDGVTLINGAQSNVIGGFNPADRNIISANGFDGIVIAGAGTNSNAVRGNFIGTDVTGRVDLGNGDQGVSIRGGAQGNTIGGSVAGARNIIGGNNSAGVAIVENDTNFNNVWGNYIGTDVTGLLPMPNLAGVFVGTGTIGPRQSSIGGLASFEQQNLIAFNTQQGVRIDGDRTNQLRVNSISNNGGLGIDLNPAFSFNAPVLTGAISSAGSTNIQGSITGTPSTGYIIDFYSSPMPDATGGVEGAIYLGSDSVFTNPSGVAFFNSNYALPSALVTATATNNNTTSNFSNPVGQAVGGGGGGDGGGTGLAVVPTGVNTATLGVLEGAAITLNADPALTVAADTSIVVNPAATFPLAALTFNVSATLDNLTIKSVSTTTIANSTPLHTVRIKSLVTQGDARLDLTDNALIVDYTGASPIDFIKSLLTSGYNNGAWNGIGIASSTAASTPNRAIGYGEASNILNIIGAQTATFAGRTVDATSVLVRFTRPGDANLDQQVNLADYNRLAGSFGQTGTLWSQGNFNFDNTTNLSDYNLLTANFGLGLGDAVLGRPGRASFGDTRITELLELA